MDKKRVLVVDDSSSVRLLLEEHLRGRGYLVQDAEGVSQALERVEWFRPDLVLTDLRMEDGTGLELIRRLRERPSGDGQPVCILLTGFGTLESAIEAMRAGAQEFLMKPVDLAELDTVVAAHLLRRSDDAGEAHSEGALGQSFNRLSTPLALLRAYIEMLAVGRCGPLTSSQEEKVMQARRCLQEVMAIARGSVGPPRPSRAQARTRPEELEGAIRQLMAAWSEDFERCGVQVAWSAPPAVRPLLGDLGELKQGLESFLAECLSKARLGMSLNLDWLPQGDVLELELRFDRGQAPLRGSISPGGGAVAEVSTALAVHRVRLTYEA